MRRILLYVGIAFPLFTSFLSVSSVVQGLVDWGAFIQDLLDVYARFVREPLQWLINLIWPNEWPNIPKVAFDIFILWTSVFGVSKMYLALESDYVKTSDGEGLNALPIAIAGWKNKILFWALGPLSIWHFSREFVSKIKLLVYLENQWFDGPLENPTLINDARRIGNEMVRGYLKLLLLSALGFVVILFLNWQLIQACNESQNALERLGICEWRLLSPLQRKAIGLHV